MSTKCSTIRFMPIKKAGKVMLGRLPKMICLPCKWLVCLKRILERIYSSWEATHFSLYKAQRSQSSPAPPWFGLSGLGFGLLSKNTSRLTKRRPRYLHDDRMISDTMLLEHWVECLMAGISWREHFCSNCECHVALVRHPK